MTFIGIDNGVTGSVGAILPNGQWHFQPTPTFTRQAYTKKKQTITRIDTTRLKLIIEMLVAPGTYRLAIERPLLNPKMFKASVSAMRALEATLITLESLGVKYEFIDSKAWQWHFYPDLSKAERDVQLLTRAKELWRNIQGHKDFDSMFIAKYLKETD